MDPLGLGLSFGAILEGIPGALDALKSLRGEPNKKLGALEGAGEAYGAFEDAAGRVLFHVQLIAEIGVPPPLTGGFWTYPAVHRSHRSFLDASERLVAEFGRIVLLGSEDAAEAAYNVGVALGEMAKSLSPIDLGPPKWMPVHWWPTKRQRIRADDTFREMAHAAGEALRQFLLAARVDLSEA